jgi:hypothetical protein
MNEGADKFANEGALKATPDKIDMSVDPKLTVTGIKLMALTQKLAYKVIWEEKMAKYGPRNRTQINIEHTKACTEDAFGKTPTEGRIWKKLRIKDCLLLC